MAIGDNATYDGIFYTRLQRGATLHQPGYSRVRHRFRGHRETEKINLEIGQMYAELSRLDSSITEAENELEAYVGDVNNGVTYSNITFTDEDATPTNANVTLEALSPFMGKLAGLENRIVRLENE